MSREKGGFWVGLAAVAFYPTTALMTRRRYEGTEWVPKTGGALIVMNHVSHLDPVYDAVFTHRQGRVPHFLAKHSLWNVPVLGAMVKGARQIPVYRGSTDAQQSLRAAHEALEEGLVVIIYPEGTITKDPDGWPMTARTGVARLALEHDVPVLPAARWGTRDLYDHYRRKFRPLPRKTVVTKVGPPVDLSPYRGRDQGHGLLREVTDVLMGEVKTLLADIRREQAPDGFYSKKG